MRAKSGVSWTNESQAWCELDQYIVVENTVPVSGPAVLSHQEGTVGDGQEATAATDDSPCQEDGEAGGESHGEPAQGGGQAGGQGGQAGSPPPTTVSA